MANFMIRFFICNVFLCGIIGILLLAKQIFKNTLSGRMQYHLWYLLLGLFAVPFMPFHPAGFPQIFSWLGSLGASAPNGEIAMGEISSANSAENAAYMEKPTSAAAEVPTEKSVVQHIARASAPAIHLFLRLRRGQLQNAGLRTKKDPSVSESASRESLSNFSV